MKKYNLCFKSSGVLWAQRALVASAQLLLLFFWMALYGLNKTLFCSDKNLNVAAAAAGCLPGWLPGFPVWLVANRKCLISPKG